jgi:hypothetical protein
MWPMVPIFTCGFVRSNFAFAMENVTPCTVVWNPGNGVKGAIRRGRGR